MAAGRRRYTDADRAAALAALDANGGDVSKTARATGVPRKTLEEWANGRVNDDVANLRQGKKLDLADALEALAWKVAEAIPGKLGAASLSQLAVTMGIMVEKMQLLRGKPTGINNDGTSDAERAERIAALLDAARARRDGAATANGHAAAPPSRPDPGASPGGPLS